MPPLARLLPGPDMDLDNLTRALQGQPDLPPINKWHPPLSGDIDILIRENGEWLHEGEPIRRHTLVKLFASILRREDDGEFYLVTPVEKWRVRVEAHPLQIVDFDIRHQPDTADEVIVTSNVERVYVLGKQYPLVMEEGIAVVMLDHGLSAAFSRPAWYRLVEHCQLVDGQYQLSSAGQRFVIGEL